jgi:peptidylprolyl isomerase
VTRFHPAVIAVLALALTNAACGSGEKKEATSLRDRIEVNSSFGENPGLKINAPLKVTKSTSWISVVGKGERVGSESTTILQFVMADGRSGKTALSTFAQGQRPIELKLGAEVFPSLVAALAGKPAKTRVVVASSADDAYGDNGAPQIGIKGGDPMVMVADILSTDPTSILDAPTGATLAAPAAAPVLKEKDGQPVGFDFAKARKVKKLTVIPLREGTGPVVEDPDRIAADYLEQVWGAKQPFEETFSKEPSNVSIGLGKVIKAWDSALAGQKEGARVMIISPPGLAYGASGNPPSIPANSTLVSVVDVLGVG